MKQLNIVIAEDSEILSKVLRQTLSGIEGFNVIGTAADGVEAIRLVKELKPHVLILDITMPLKSGIEVLAEIRKDDSSTVIVMFTSDSGQYIRQICLEAGANFFLDKSQITELIEICNAQLLGG